MATTIIDDFVALQTILIKKEMDLELEKYQKNMNTMEKHGKLISGLQLVTQKSSLNGSTLMEFKSGIGGKIVDFRSFRFKVGDIVEIIDHSSKSTWKITGTITRLKELEIYVQVKEGEKFQDMPNLIKLVQMGNPVTWRRLLDTLTFLQTQPPTALTKVLFQMTLPTKTSKNLTFHNQTLNESQKTAVQNSLEADTLYLIHGPPGTGKTQTCIEIILQLVKTHQKVLVCGPSNISVDNLVERLSKSKIDMVRIGHPARILDSVMMYSLDILTSTSEGGEIVKGVRKELDYTLSKASTTKRKSEKYKLYQDCKGLRIELKRREKDVVEGIIRNADVVLTTLSSSASKLLNTTDFDVVLIDEASQALEVESWIGIRKAKKLILAGDHLQLPPTINQTGEGEKTLSMTLFERLLKIYGDEWTTLLNVQYRMHRDIMDFSSKSFYNGLIKADDTVASRLLTDFEYVKETEETSVPLVYIDTAGHDLIEIQDDEESKFNDGEIHLVLEYLEKLVKAGVRAEDVVVISPYSAQISRLRKELQDQYPGLELGTVDGLQGREKEVVILTLVRSNSRGEVGFLKESRRLNVALTRPKRHLCVIGDSQTLSRDLFLKGMIEYLEERAEVRVP